MKPPSRAAQPAGGCPTPVRVTIGGQERTKRCGRRQCPSCGVLWAGDVRLVLMRAITAYGGDVALVTITAPGADVLPWVPGTRKIEPAAARRWNRQARHEWRKLHNIAAARVRRRARRDGFTWGVLAGAWAYQERGALHRHQVVPMSSASDRLYSKMYADELAALAEAHGFGFVDRGKRTRGQMWRRNLEVIPPHRAGGYLAKYVAGHKRGGRLEIAETVSHPDVPRNVYWVHPGLLHQAGVSMRILRRRRWAHCERERMRERGEVEAYNALQRAAIAHVMEHGGDVDAIANRLLAGEALIVAPRGPGL